MENSNEETEGNNYLSQEDSIAFVIDEAIDEIKGNTNESLRKCAARLEALGLTKSTVCIEMIHRFKFVCSERTIRRALGPEYKDQSKVRGQMSANDSNKDLEEDAAKIRENLGIGLDAEPDEPSDGMVKRLQERLKIALDERNYYRDQMIHYKSLIEANKEVYGITEGSEVAIFADCYEEIADLMRKSPNGLILQHDGYNVFRWRKMTQAKKPNVQKSVTSEDVKL